MTVKNMLLGAAAAATLVIGSSAMAAEPVQLSDTQMDDVTAGFLFAFAGTGGFGTQFLGVVADADVSESSEVSQSESDSLTIGTGGTGSGSYSATATAKSSIKGNFKTLVGGGIMETGGTLAFSGNLKF
jgi:TRAP-type uncharacterized transport system substrate-binding protein